MRNKKLLYVLIPVLIVVLVIIAGLIYLTLNGTPESIFKNAINRVFGAIESDEGMLTTMKGTINLTADVESENEQMQAVNTMLEGTSIGLNMEADTENFIVKEDLNVTVSNESILNALILIQDQKGYVYLKDWLDKYLELPEEMLEYSELTEYYDNIATLDQNKLMEAIEEELIEAISNQELVQEKTTLVLDGKETKVTASTLSLKDTQVNTFYSGLFTNLRQSEKFQAALGEYKDEVLTAIDEMVQEMGEAEDLEFVFTIYTKGFLNKFVGVSAKSIDTYYEEVTGLDILKHNDEKHEFVAYNEYEGEREETLKLTIEDKKESKDKGTATITITVDEEELVLVYNYETKGNQTTFVLSTEVEGVKIAISGNTVKEGKNVNGNFVISVQEESFGKVNLNCAYDFTYDVEIQKVDVQNAVLINELSEEDQTELMTNLQSSTLYQLIGTSGLFEETESDYYDEPEISYNEPEVTSDGYTVKYNVPDGFKVSRYSSEDYKMYDDENYNSVDVSIEWDSVDTYMSYLDEEYVLTSEYYENQQISDVKTYNVNGKEYKFRTITYNDEYASYINLYFAYELDDEYCYLIEVESEDRNISMDTLKYFLDIVIE